MIVAVRNLHAGRGRRHLPSRELAARLGAGAQLVETASLEDLDRAAREIARAGPRLVVVYGGDGTVGATLTALDGACGGAPLPPLGLLPGGTMNVIARSVGASGPVERTLARLVDALRGRRPLVEKRTTGIRVGRRVGLLFGVGLFANFLERYNGGERGMARAVGLLARAGAEAVTGGSLARRLFARFRARLVVDGVAWPEREWVNVSAGSVAGLGFGFAPYVRAGERPGCFHLIAHRLSPLGALAELPRIRLGLGMKDVEQAVAARALIEAERPLVYGLDGDTLAAEARFELAGGPALRLVVP